MATVLNRPTTDTIKIVYDPFEKQVEFHRRVMATRWTLFAGGAGSGKTTAGAQEAIRHAFRFPGVPGLIGAPNYPMLRRATQRKFLEILPPEAIASFNRSENHMMLTNGTIIDFVSTHDPDSLYGTSVGWIWLDEGMLMPRKAFDIFVGRLREGPEEHQDGWITATPKGMNWGHDEFRTGKPERDGVFDVSSADNPHLSEGFLADLRGTYTGAFYDQEFLGRFVKFEGLIYPMIEDSIHQATRQISDMTAIYACEDHGFDHPWVFLVFGVDGDGRYHFFEEFHERHVTVDDRIDRIQERMSIYNMQTVECSPERPEIIEAYKAAGIPARKAENAVIEGISAVSTALSIRPDGKPGCTFDPAVVETYAELKQYQWRKGQDDKPSKEAPLKVKDDGPDAVRYGIFTHAKEVSQPCFGIEVWDIGEDDY